MAISGNNITIELGGDTLVPINIEDEDGTPLDLTTVQLRFEVQPLLELVPLQTSSPFVRMVRLTEQHGQQIGTKARKFQLIRDEGDFQTVLWRGTIVGEGWLA